MQVPRHCWMLPGRAAGVSTHGDHWESDRDGEGGQGFQQPVLKSGWAMFLLAAVHEQSSAGNSA